MRTIINIDDRKVEQIAAFCQRYKISRAELIRQSIDEFLSAHAQAKDEVFGIWKNKPVDALAYQRKLRAEWNDDESDI